MPLQFTSTQAGSSSNYFRYIWDSKVKLTDRYRDSRLLDFALAPVDSAFVKLERGAYIQIETENFPVWFTGYVINDPELEYLGSKNGSPVYGYRYQATSDEFVLSLKPIGIVPPFLNTTQGAILRSLAERLAPGVFNLDAVQDGPFIAQYVPDPQKKFFDIVQEFCESSSFLFYARSKALVFAPQDDASMEIVLDGADQHFTPSRLKIRPGSSPIINDATVLGAIEPQAYVHEYFVGTGLDAAFPLISSVFGVEQSVLLDEPFSSEGIDAAKWQVKDTINNWLRVEEGYLNVLGGTGSYDDVYVASNSPIPLENKIRFTHGEWDFLSGTGVIAALWAPSSPGASFSESDLVYALKFNGSTLAPIVGGSVDGTQSIAVDTSKRYVIRTIAWFGRERRIPSTYSYLDSTGAVGTFSGAGEPDEVAWNTLITEVDPSNGQVTNQYTFHNLSTLDGTTDAFATYVPVASSSLHANVTAITISVPVSAALEMATLPPFKNLGFDSWTDGNPDNWGTASTQNVAEETTNVNSGSSLAMTPASGDQAFVAQSAVGLIQPDTEYTIICRLRRSTSMTSGALRVQLLGTDLTDSGATFNMVSVPPAEYETFSAKLTAPIGTIPEDIELRLYTEGCPNGATLYVDDVIIMTAWQPRILGPNELDAMDGMSPVATVVAGNTENKSAILNSPQYNPGQAELVFFKDSVNLTSTIPLDNQLVRLSYRSAGASVARVLDRASVQTEAVRWGDDGLRSVVRTDLTPKPRTTLECEMAAAALVSENSYGHYEGTYEQWGQYLDVEPRAGAIIRFENMPADMPGIQAEEISEVVTTLEGKSGSTEFFNHIITFGKPDRIRRLLSRFDEPKGGFQKATDTVAPSAIAVEAVGSSYAGDVVKPSLLGWDNNYIYIDAGQNLDGAYGLHFEVRYTDEGWGVDDGKNLVLRTTQRKFAIPRSSRGRIFFVRQVFRGNLLPWSEDQTQGSVYSSTASLSKVTALNPDNKYSQICKGMFSTGSTLTASFNASVSYSQYCWSFSIKGPAGKAITAKFGSGSANVITLTGFWQRVSVPFSGVVSGSQSLVVTYTGSGSAELSFARYSVEGNRLSESGYYKTTSSLYGPTSRYSAAVHVGFPVTFATDGTADEVVDPPGDVTVVSQEDPDFTEAGYVRLRFRLGVPSVRNGFAGVDPWLQSPVPEDTTPMDLTDEPAPRLQNPGWQWFDPSSIETEFDVELRVPAPSRNEKWRVTLSPRTLTSQFAPVFTGSGASPYVEFDVEPPAMPAAPAVLSTEFALGKNVFERSDGTKAERWRVRANWQENTAAENYEYHWYTNLYVQWSGGAVVRLASEHPNGVRPFHTDWFEFGAPDTGTFFFRPVNKAGVESAAQGHTSIYVSPMPNAPALLSPSGSIKYGVFTDEQGNKTLKYRPEMSWTLDTGHPDFNYHYYVLVRFQPMSGGTPVGSPIVLGGFHPTDVAETDWFPIGSPITYRLEYVPVNRVGVLGTPQIVGTFNINTMPDAPAVLNLDGGFEYSVFSTDEGDKMRYRVWADWDLNTGHPNYQYHYYVRMELVPVDSGGTPIGAPILVAGVHPDEPLPWKTDYFDIGAPQKYRLQVRAVNRLEEGGTTQTIVTEDVDGMPDAPNVTSPTAETTYQVTDTPDGRKAYYGFLTSWTNGTGNNWLDHVEPTAIIGSDVIPLAKEVTGPPAGKKYFHGWFELPEGTEITGTVSIQFRCFNKEGQQTASPATVSGLSISYTAARNLPEPSLEAQFLGRGLARSGSLIVSSQTNAANLLYNGDFSASLQAEGWGFVDGTGYWDDAPENVYAGDGGIVLEANAGIVSDGDNWIACKPGDRFYLEVYVRRHWSDGGCRAHILFHDVGHTTNTAIFYVDQPNSIPVGEWHKISISGVAPANTAFVGVLVRPFSTTNGGWWFVDSILLREQIEGAYVSPDALGDGLTHTGGKIRNGQTNAANLLNNPGFEADQQLSHWTPAGGSVWTNNGALIHTGTGAVLMPAGSNLMYADKITCKAGDTYAGKMWALNYAGSADGYIRVVVGFFDTAGAYITHNEAAVLASASGWTQSAAAICTAPANAATVYYQVITNSTTGNWALDSCSLVLQSDADGIKDLAVGSGKLVDAAVIAAKLADSAVITSKLANAAVDTGKLADLAVIATKLANGSVDFNKLQDSAVITQKLANFAVDNSKLGSLAVDAAKLANSAVTSTKIANAAVGTAAIANAAVGNAHIQNAAVQSAQIADLAVINGKIANAAVGSAAIAALAVGSAHIGSSVIQSTHIGTAQIISAHIANLQVNDSHIANLNVGKLTSGTLLVSSTTAGVAVKYSFGNQQTNLWPSIVSCINSSGNIAAEIGCGGGDGAIELSDTFGISRFAVSVSVKSLWLSGPSTLFDGVQLDGANRQVVINGSPVVKARYPVRPTDITGVINLLVYHGLSA
jgi:hypothetical protein